jgi:hypothetical protein
VNILRLLLADGDLFMKAVSRAAVNRSAGASHIDGLAVLK